MITIDASFWSSVGVESFDGNANGNQRDFYNSMVVNGVAVNNKKDFFQNSTVNGIVYYNQWDWYKAIGTFYSEPIYDQYSFYQNVTFDGINKVGNQKDFFKGITEICRYLTTLDGAADYYTIPTVSLSSDFFISFKITTTNLGLMYVVGDGAGWSNYIQFNSLLKKFILRFNNDAVTLDFTIIEDLADGNLHNIEVVRVSGVCTVSIDGVVYSEDSARTDTDTFAFDVIGKTQSTGFYNGIISDLKIDNTRYYKLDEDLSTTSTIIDSGTDGLNGTAVNITASEYFCKNGSYWEGIELIDNGDFSNGATSWNVGAGWNISGGTANFPIVSGSNSFISQVTAMSADNFYKTKYSIVSVDSGDFQMFLGNGAAIVAKGIVKNFIESRERGTDGIAYLFALTGFVGSVDNISIRRLIQENPKTNIHTLGDSFATNSFDYQNYIKINSNLRYSDFTFDAIGGTTLAQQKIRFDSTPQYYDDVLIIMDGGLDDTEAAAISAIDAMVAHLTHSNWVYVQPSPAEEIEGSAARIAWNTKVNNIIAHVGVGHYVECLTELQAANDGSANDLLDVANNIVPRSLRVDTIHETEKGTNIRTKQIYNFINSKGW
mgnify:CR=1 FL=1|tara:strand:- start:6137 stop:7945 length:1809 start_codon:yes stop_codon:yes gene_type:complete